MGGLMRYREGRAARLYMFLDGLFTQPYAILRHIWRQLLLLGAMLASAAFTFMYFQGLDPLTATVAAVSTISTIGFYAPPLNMPNVEKVYLIIIMIVSVGSAASMVQGIVTSVVKREIWAEDAERRRISRMKRHAILVGYTQIGRYAAQRLIETGIPFCVVTRRKENLKELSELNIPHIVSDLQSPIEVLEQCNVEEAGHIILALESDNMNMVLLLAAKRVNPGIRAITVSNVVGLSETFTKAGADVVVPIYNVVGSVLAYSVTSDKVMGAIFSADQDLNNRHLVEVVAKPGSKLVGMKLKDLPAEVLMVNSGGGWSSFTSPDTEVREGDRLMCLTDHDSMKRLMGLAEAVAEAEGGHGPEDEEGPRQG